MSLINKYRIRKSVIDSNLWVVRRPGGALVNYFPSWDKAMQWVEGQIRDHRERMIQNNIYYK